MEFAWSTILTFVVFLVGGGLTLSGKDYSHFRAATICFVVSAIILGGMSVVWESLTVQPLWWRLVVGGAIGAVIGIGLPESIRWVKHRELSTIESTRATPAAPAHAPASDPVANSNPHFDNGVPRLVFRPSAAFTKRRRDRISKHISDFHHFLRSLGVPTSSDSINLVADSRSRNYYQHSIGNKDEIYNNVISLPSKDLDDKTLITERYSQYVFFRVAALDNRYDYKKDMPDPKNPATWKSSVEQTEYRFRNELSRSVSVYLSQSYWKSQQDDPFGGKDYCLFGPNSPFFPAEYWWNIETALSRGTANQIAVYIVLAAWKTPMIDQRETIYQYVYRLFNVTQGMSRDPDQTKKVYAALNKCGYLSGDKFSGRI